MAGTLRLMAATALLLQAIACAASGGPPKPETRYRVDLGRVTARVLDEELRRILGRYRYELVRSENRGTSLYYETHWNLRDMMADEIELGYQSAETRIIVEASQGTEFWLLDPARSDVLFRVEFVAENRLRRTPEYDWEEVPMTEMFREYIDRIARELEREIRSRIQ
jgi:hypothetical protein